jgi:hypothetical protein
MSERDRRRDREHERNRGVAIRLWKREGIILPGFAGTIARWRQQNRLTEEGNR